ncbi:MAG: UDP-N-acetylglucosamine 2-epimerase (non-hydrolyzing) [Candidatus Caldatribacteriota bacterium]|nr:UDP-N-acetylglucosamine 2-epimerase (non-hydrolyzing) [Candidatus Caldatribacteriota bacterium]
MSKIKLALIFGTRPETIKMFPIISEMERFPEFIDYKIILSGQHREMLDQMLTAFRIQSDYNLNIMKKDQSLSQIFSKSLNGIEKILIKEKPDMVLVQGDTTTTFAGAIAAFFQKIKVAHIEAGLRTNNKYYPFPEEMNRHLTGVLADLHFTPTEKSYSNLLFEGVNKEKIFISGNTVIDALFSVVRKDYSFKEKALKNKALFKNKIILITMHRRENWGQPLKNICNALTRILKDNPDVNVIFPMHKNPRIREAVNKILKNEQRMILLDTLNYKDIINLIAKSFIILTDSGGIQEEAPSLGKPVLVLRNETERPEALEVGMVELVGTNEDRIVGKVNKLLTDKQKYQEMVNTINPYGDGKASERIVKKILNHFNLIDQPPIEFKAK